MAASLPRPAPALARARPPAVPAPCTRRSPAPGRSCGRVVTAAQSGAPMDAERAPAGHVPQPGKEASPGPRDGWQPRADGFSWADAWYPLAPVAYLSRSHPAAVTVLGRQLAVWYHRPTSTWRAFDDRCPHRLAPLSEGRIESSGDLQCTYHGWQFGPDGACTRIPQIAGDTPQAAAACASGRACVAEFPVREEQGMLWVWMSPQGQAAAHTSPLPLPTELAAAPGGGQPTGLLLGGWYQRELPLPAELVLENLLDPAHVHFSHHGVIGRRERAGPVTLELAAPPTPRGFTLSVRHGQPTSGATAAEEQGRRAPPAPWPMMDAPAGSPEESAFVPPGVSMRVHFVPPGLVWQEFGVGGSRFSMLFYVVPVAPGASRFLAAYSTDALPPGLRAAVAGGALAPLAPLAHALQFAADLSAHEVLDGDALHIHRQALALAAEGRDWRRSYFMPAGADRGVLLLRQWLDEHAGGGTLFPPGAQAPPGAPAGGRALSKAEVLDRYEQHTRSCPSCRRALGAVRATRHLLQTGSTASLAAALALALAPPAPGPLGRPRSLALALAAAALVAAAGEQAAAGFEQRFVQGSYNHSER